LEENTRNIEGEQHGQAGWMHLRDGRVKGMLEIRLSGFLGPSTPR
jgi:hypothetical protein